MGHGLRSVCRTRTWCAGAVAGLCLVLDPVTGFAQTGEVERELIQLDYDASDSCPSRADFVEQVRAYTSRWTLAEAGAARHFRLKLEPRDERVVGTLEIVERTGLEGADTSAPRVIAGPDCTTVARGMAVAVAVAIDPSVLLGDRGTDGEREPPAPLAPPVSRPERSRPVPQPPAREPPAPARLAADARFELTSAVVTGLLAVVSAAFEVDPFAPSGRDLARRPAWLRPSFAIGLRQSLPREIERSTVTTDFLWTAAVVRLCPARFVTANRRLELTPCLESNAGVLRADASGAADARRTTNLWLDAGASARATWSPDGAWFIGAAGGMVLPISRNRFELSTRSLVSQAPRVGITFGLTGGLRF